MVAGSSAEDIMQGEKVKGSSVWQHLQEKDDTEAECTHCHHEFKTEVCKYCYLKRMHPNISICISN